MDRPVSGPGPASLAWLDPWWDEQTSLLWNPEGSFTELAPARSLHLVPQSGWWALGVLHAGDTARAEATFSALCDLQYDEPGTPWHGSFSRFMETPHPGPGAVEWVDYDPNWRQFLGTTFSLALRHGGLSAPVAQRVERAIALAVAGEPPSRVPPSYSNIALMRAWLEVEHGEAGTALPYAEQVVAAFDEHDAFDEYNSPTYYGIDLFALALWRGWSGHPTLREAGGRIEATLWRDVARWHHAGLRNLCGPWDRSYGMDMREYLGSLGLFIWEATGDGSSAPVPDLDRPLDHSHDICKGPVAPIVGVQVPADVLPALTAFGGEHGVDQHLPGGRRATGWLGDDRMIGAEEGSPNLARGQFHPATMHWRGEDGSVSWLRVRHQWPLDAVAEPGVLRVRPRDPGTTTVLVHGDPAAVTMRSDAEAAPPERRDGLHVTRFEHATTLDISFA